jgi:ribonuclease HI
VIPKIVIYTDGACSGNPGPGGWGAVMRSGKHSKELYGSESDTTNNRMEIMGAIKALESLKSPSNVQIFTDSKYLKDGISDWIHNWIKNNWVGSNKKLVKNADLWQTLYNLSLKHEIEWSWVKGHGSNEGNIAADRLATKGRDEAKGLLCQS